MFIDSNSLFLKIYTSGDLYGINPSDGYSDYILEYDLEGNFVNSNIFEYNQASYFSVLSDGEIYISGYPNNDVFLAHVNSDGDITTSIEFDSGGWEWVNGMTIGPKENIYLWGNSFGNIDDNESGLDWQSGSSTNSFLAQLALNTGQASFSIPNEIAYLGETLSVVQTGNDPDGEGDFSYSWQSSSNNSNWTEFSIESTYEVQSSEVGKSIRTIISYQDHEAIMSNLRQVFRKYISKNRK